MKIAIVKEGKIKCPYCGYKYTIKNIRRIKSCPACKRYFEIDLQEDSNEN